MKRTQQRQIPPEHTPAPALTVCIRILRAYRDTFQNDSNADPLAVLGVLDACFHEGVRNQRELQALTGLSQPQVSRIVAALARAGILIQSGAGRRDASKIVELSPWGVGALKQFDRAIRNALKGFARKRKRSATRIRRRYVSAE